MSYRSPSIIFPELQNDISRDVRFSREEIHTMCELKSVSFIASSMLGYIAAKNRTIQQKHQYAAMQAAVDAEYTELENQAYIQFQEMTSRLRDEFNIKQEMLSIELQKAENEADKAFHEQNIAFERYVKTSNAYRQIFDVLNGCVNEIGELIHFSKENEIATNTRFYCELCEKYRLYLTQIDKFQRLINGETE